MTVKGEGKKKKKKKKRKVCYYEQKKGGKGKLHDKILHIYSEEFSLCGQWPVYHISDLTRDKCF